MDQLIASAGRALAAGDPLDALNCIALRDDAPALALRGLAMAQLGDLQRARLLLRRAAARFGTREAVARARCTLAEAEIALVSRDLGWPAQRLDQARSALRRHGDAANAAHAGYLAIRRLLLIGRLDEAERLTEKFDPAPLPLPSLAAYHLVLGGIAIRRVRIAAAREQFRRAMALAGRSGIAALAAEVERAARVLDAPAARRIGGGRSEMLRLEDVERLLASKLLVVDACRNAVSLSGQFIALGTRPVLFALARALAEAFPDDASRASLLQRAFGARHADESHRVRLRVEIGRLRKAIEGIAGVEVTRAGFKLTLSGSRNVAVLAPPADEAHAGILALLSDGEAWSSSALALAVGASQRTVQRALDELAAGGKAQAIGNGRTRRWMAPPLPGFPSTLLLPSVLPGG